MWSPRTQIRGRPWRCFAVDRWAYCRILYLRGRDGATVAVHPSVLGSAVAPIARLASILRVRPQGLHAQVVLAPEAAADVTERLRQSLIAAVASTGAVAPAVDVQPVSALQREPGGKLRVVRSV